MLGSFKLLVVVESTLVFRTLEQILQPELQLQQLEILSVLKGRCKTS